MTGREIYNQLEYLEARWRFTESNDPEYIQTLIKAAEDFAKKEFKEVNK